MLASSFAFHKKLTDKSFVFIDFQTAKVFEDSLNRAGGKGNTGKIGSDIKMLDFKKMVVLEASKRTKDSCCTQKNRLEIGIFVRFIRIALNNVVV